MEKIKQFGSAVTEKLQEVVTPSVHGNLMTKLTGCPVGDNLHSLTAGRFGPVVVQDVHLLEKVKQFTREKIPARNVHALGCGAFGNFTVTNDISKYTCADLFNSVGKKTEVMARFSGIFTEQGDADTTRDPRGFALKFYTKEGNWDLMGINTPVFAVRDMKNGPDAVHAFKRDPRNGCWNQTQTWDYVANHPEGLHQIAMLYTNRTGTPISYRMMNAYSCHTFSLINDQKKRFWVKFHIKSLQGTKGLKGSEAKVIAGEDPNFLSKDLFNSIKDGNYPKWKLMMQVMEEEEGYKNPWTFDATKCWKQSDYPLIEIGIIEMNRNPIDYFNEVEQVGFAPTNFVPGIGLSPDKLLQGRLLVYDDAQYHRIGPNYKQLEVNKPHQTEPHHNYYGGAMNCETRDKFPHYYPSSFGGFDVDPKYIEPPLKLEGDPVGFYKMANEGSEEDYYSQVKDFWNILSEEDRNDLIENLSISFEKVDSEKVIGMMIEHFSKCNKDWGVRLEERIKERKRGERLKDNEMMILKIQNDLLKVKVNE